MYVIIIKKYTISLNFLHDRISTVHITIAARDNLMTYRPVLDLLGQSITLPLNWLLLCCFCVLFALVSIMIDIIKSLIMLIIKIFNPYHAYEIFLWYHEAFVLRNCGQSEALVLVILFFHLTSIPVGQWGIGLTGTFLIW